MSWFRRGREKSAADPVEWVTEKADSEAGPGDVGGVGLFEESASASRRGYDAGAGPTPTGRTPTGPTRAEAVDRSGGPWDASEVEPTEGYIDLGALRLPAHDGMELRLEVEEESGRVISATAQIGASAVQLQAFAAPRSAGIWEEIREEIAQSIVEQGGEADRTPGPFGAELLARVPARGPDGRVAFQAARFVGVDGPRWFLRAVFHGPAAFSEDEAHPLEALVRASVVVRGSEAMAPRELLTLQVPGMEQADEQDDADSGPVPLSQLAPGPTISEVR